MTASHPEALAARKRDAAGRAFLRDNRKDKAIKAAKYGAAVVGGVLLGGIMF